MALPQGVRAVVTGGAKGIGRELTRGLARRGGHIVIADTDLAGAEAAALEAARSGNSAHAVRCDVRLDAEVERLATRAHELLGGVDLLVNNAGVLVTGEATDTEILDYQRVIDVNLWGVIHGCRHFVPRMKERGRGHVLNVASLAGVVALPQMGPYSATKAAVIAYSEALRAELSAHGVGVTVLCPSFTQTGLLDAQTGAAGTQTHRAGRALMSSLGARPEVVARSALDAADRGALYAVPSVHGRLAWQAKRLVPEGFKHVTSMLQRLVA